MKIELGAKVKDKITGFKGVVVGVTHWLNGCTRIGIQSEKLSKAGKIVDTEWIDEEQVVLLKASSKKKAKKSGGPQADPKY